MVNKLTTSGNSCSQTTSTRFNTMSPYFCMSSRTKSCYSSSELAITVERSSPQSHGPKLVDSRAKYDESTRHQMETTILHALIRKWLTIAGDIFCTAKSRFSCYGKMKISSSSGTKLESHRQRMLAPVARTHSVMRSKGLCFRWDAVLHRTI